MDFFTTWPEKGVREAGRERGRRQRAGGLRENSRRSRGKIAFSGRDFAGTESERIRRSVELPGTPAEGAVRP